MLFKNITSLYVVYGHSVEGSILYIGTGLIARAFDLNQRSESWKTLLSGRNIDVVIFEHHPSKAVALRSERVFIKQLRPVANNLVAGNNNRIRNHRYYIKCDQTGETFSTLAAASEATGVSQGAISSVLSGRYKSVKGFTFSYGDALRIKPLGFKPRPDAKMHCQRCSRIEDFRACHRGGCSFHKVWV